MSRADILAEIVAHKRIEVSARKKRAPLEQIKEAVSLVAPPRNFLTAMKEKIAHGEAAVIAEIKKASPSKGIIREDFNPVELARQYEEGGAACLSVLTDERFFQGADAYLTGAREACTLPALRKDFTIDSYQVWEARALGADAILLIAAILDVQTLGNLQALAHELGMAALIETHDQKELQAALTISPPLLGINNRDLRTFETRLTTTLDLLSAIPSDTLLVTESGIHSQSDVQTMRNAGVSAFLIGEGLLKHPHPGHALKDLFAL